MAFIVIIDDEEALAEMYAYQLRNSGHQTVEFSESQTALAYLKTHCPDVVVTDMRMPHVSGAEICRFVGENYPDCGLIVVSSFAEADLDLHQRSVHTILKKPFSLDTLDKAVRRALSDCNRVKKAG